MRDNFALWAAWWSVLIFWCALLFGEATTLNCFDKKFEEKKWTCWSYYSLFYLAHEEFFTRMMRLVPHYLNFSWQACVAAILYCHIGETYQDASTIAWYPHSLTQVRSHSFRLFNPPPLGLWYLLKARLQRPALKIHSAAKHQKAV